MAAVGSSNLINETLYIPTRTPCPVDHKEIETELAAAEKTVATLSATLHQHALYVYGRVAEGTKVDVEYQRWQKTVDACTKELSACGTKIVQLTDKQQDSN